MFRHVLTGALASVVFASAPAIAATTIDFSGFPRGEHSGTIVTPEATFASSSGDFYVGAAGLDHEICPLTSDFDCAASLNVTFSKAVDGLTFLTSGYDSAAQFVVNGFDAAGAFSTTISTSGSYNFLINLSAFAGIKSLSFSTDDPAGIAYDHFTFTSSVPEPATWSLMIVGFGLVGAAMRRPKSYLTHA
jgi:hypothetical protein